MRAMWSRRRNVRELPGWERLREFGTAESSLMAASSAPTAPVYGASTSGAAKPSTSAPWNGGHDEYSAPGGYKESPTTSVSPAKSTVSGPVMSTVYVIPVGSTTKPATWTAVPSVTSTTPKPAQYTGAASKPVVGMSMIAAVFCAIFFL